MRSLAGEYLAPALRAVLDASNLEGADRSLVTDISYGTVRRLIQIDSSLSDLLKAPGKLPPRVLAALRIASYEMLHRGTPTYAAVSAWVEIIKWDTPALAGLANAVLRRVGARAGDAGSDDRKGSEQEAPADELSLPAWLLQRFESALGCDAARQAALGMLEPEPLWLTAFSPKALELLDTDGCEVSEGPRFTDIFTDIQRREDGESSWPQSLAVRSPLPLNRLAAFRQGLVQPQNPSSLYAALMLGAARDEKVLDLASGQGVKSAVLAASGAEVVSVELLADRSRAAQANLERLSRHQELKVRHLIADLSSPPTDELLAAVGEPATSALLDAPCSGTGTLRGNPEIKLRLTPADVATLVRTQAALLDTATELLAPGGRLLYAVCALTPEEGPEQIDNFLGRHKDFEALAFRPGLPHVSTTGGNFILPVNGLDGFFLSLMRKN